MTTKTPIERGAEALMEAVLAGSRTLSPAQAVDAAQTAYEAIDTEQLAGVISEHYWLAQLPDEGAECACGERISDGNEYALGKHQRHLAQAVKSWLTGKAEA